MAGQWDFIKYTFDDSVKGDSKSQMVISCDLVDAGDVSAAFLANGGVYDERDSERTRRCQHVSGASLGDDDATGKAILTCDFWPANKAETTEPDQPFKWRLGWKSEAFTMGKKTWKWSETNHLLTANDPPVLRRWSLTEIILYGTRTSINLATFDAYEDKVNSDVFLGASAGKVLFETATAEPRQKAKSSDILISVEVHLVRRSIEWNKDWNVDTGEYQTPVIAFGDNSGKTKLEAVAFAPLLQAP